MLAEQCWWNRAGGMVLLELMELVEIEQYLWNNVGGMVLVEKC